MLPCNLVAQERSEGTVGIANGFHASHRLPRLDREGRSGRSKLRDALNWI